MKDKRKRLTLLLGSILVITIGITYAYYSASVEGTGNTNAESSATTATLGEVEFNGDTTFDTTNVGRDIYPGFIGVQTFTISPYSDGRGIYEINLEANVPEAFGSDIKITLYKTSDATNNNIESEEGQLTITNNQYVKQDTLTITGALDKVYEGALTDTDEEILEQVEFLISNNEFTEPDTTPDYYYTYYVVYEYLDNGNQNNQQGLDFDSKITVKYVDNLRSLADETLDRLHQLNSSINVLQSSSSNPVFARPSPSGETAGIKNNGWEISSSDYITYASDFSYDEQTGIYTLLNYTTCQISSCYNDLTNKYFIYLVSDANKVVYMSDPTTNNEVTKITNVTVSGSSAIFDVIYYKGSELNEVKEGTWSTQTSGIYEAEDDYGTSYYFRGGVTNNYVKFADFYWRIVRINGDGTVRLIYFGDVNVIDSLDNRNEVLTNNYQNGDNLFTLPSMTPDNDFFNTNEDDNAYVGYMYGTPNSNTYEATHANIHDSNIKTTIDRWYKYSINNQCRYDGNLVVSLSASEEDCNNVYRTGWEGSYSYYDSSVIEYVGVGNYQNGYCYFGNNHSKLAGSAEYCDDIYYNNLEDEYYLSNYISYAGSGVYKAYGNYIADEIFCNDRSLASSEAVEYEESNGSGYVYDGNGYGDSPTMYGALGRLIEQEKMGLGNKATLKCPNKNDAFTVSDTTNGNGELTYPVGLITADEANMAGVVLNSFGIDNYSYLINNNNIWTMSPSNIILGNANNLYYNWSIYDVGVRYDDPAPSIKPVINLKKSVINAGSGTIQDPFRVE